MSKKNNTISKENLIKRIAKKAGISKEKAKKAYKAIFSDGPTIKRQKKKVVKVKKKVPVKILKEITLVTEANKSSKDENNKNSLEIVKKLRAKIVDLEKKLKPKNTNLSESKKSVKTPKKSKVKLAQKKVKKVKEKTSLPKSKIKATPSKRIEKNPSPKSNSIQTKAISEKKTITPKRPLVKKPITPIIQVQNQKSPEDLTKIEGIGPAISSLLKKNGILTFQELANTRVMRIQEILDQGGGRFRVHKPDTWPKQSALAAQGKWEELKTLQGQLKGGR